MLESVNLLPLSWRSLLFIPADNSRFVESASRRGADAVILDLEDSVADANKVQARQGIAGNVLCLNECRQQVAVRVNQGLIDCAADLDVAVIAGVQALVVSKVTGPDHVRLIAAAVTELEVERHLPLGHIRIIAMIETVKALSSAYAIAASSERVAALALGTEDLSLDGGFEPTEENLFYPAQQMVMAAKSAGRMAYGFPGSIADYSDIDRFKKVQAAAKSMGFDGGLCIHPSQVGPINSVYSITDEELHEAQKVIAAYERAATKGAGAVALDDKMIDLPVVERARALLGLVI